MSDRKFTTCEVSNLEDVITKITAPEFDNLTKYGLKSRVPNNCLNESCVFGVDEAGRGPVLGPMVYAVFYCSVKELPLLTEIGCTDSKALKEQEREKIFELINNTEKYNFGWVVDIISPNFISNSMQKRVKYSLNEIAENSTVNLIIGLVNEKVNLQKLYVDTIGPPHKYQEKLSKLFPQCEVVVSKKADSLYPVVGAASICAKVIRDNVISHWKFLENVRLENSSDYDFGSGYPNDPKTKEFLNEYKDDVFGFSSLVRFSWSTATKIQENLTEVKWEDEIYENFPEKMAISSYFKSVTNSGKHKTKCFFLKDRSLQSAEHL